MHLTDAARDRFSAMATDWLPAGGGAIALGILSGDESACVVAGAANVELLVPAHRGTGFRIGSVSKHFACAMALLLQREGFVSLDEPIDRAVPGLGDQCPWAGKATLRHLCTNTAGAPDFLDLLHLTGAGLAQPTPSSVSLDLVMRGAPQNFRAGSRMIYSAGGFLLLSHALERLTGRPMAALLTDRLFGPAGMSTAALLADDRLLMSDMAGPYVAADGGGLLRGGWGLELNCEGGIVASVDDMLAWARYLFQDPQGQWLLDAMAGVQPGASFDARLYRHGLVAQERSGVATLSHSGRTPGFRAELVLAPDQRGAVVVLCNDGRVETDALARTLIATFLADGKRRGPQTCGSSAPDWASLAGLYVGDDDALELVADGDHGLIATASGRYRLEPLGNGRLRPLALAWDAEVTLDPVAGTVTILDCGKLRRFSRALVPPPAMPQDVAGRYVNAALETCWELTPAPGGLDLTISGPRGRRRLFARAVAGHLLILDPAPEAMSAHRPRIAFERDATGRVQALTASTERTLKLRLLRDNPGGTRLDG